MAKIRTKMTMPKSFKSLAPKLKAKVDIAVKETTTNAVADMQLAIKSGSKTGRIYKKRDGKLHQASAAGEAPASDTGDLINSLAVNDVGFAKSETVVASKNAVYLEYGTSRMKKRPFARPAIAEARRELNLELKQILKEAKKGF